MTTNRRSGIEQAPLIAVPVYGHRDTYASVVKRLLSLGCDVLIIDDGNSPPLKAVEGAELIRMESNAGVGAGTLAAIRWADDRGYPGVLSVDADDAHPVASVGEVLAHAIRRPKRPIMTSRFGHIGEWFIPKTKIAANYFAASLFLASSGYRFSDVASGLRYYPASILDMHLKQDRFAFVYEALVAVAERFTDVDVVPIFCSYPDKPLLGTDAEELRQFVSYLDGISTNNEIRDVCGKVLGLLQEETHRSISVSIGGQTFVLEFVPPLRECFMSFPEHGYPEYRNDRPSLERLVAGIIPDGNRRWACANGLSISAGYEAAVRQMCDFAAQQRHAYSVLLIYWLSIFNLTRSPGDLAAIYSSLTLMREQLADHDLTAVFYGDLEALPPEICSQLVAANAHSGATGTEPLIVVAVAYSVSWEEKLKRGIFKPWAYGLTPSALQRVWEARANILLRTGGAKSLSDFLPQQMGYSKIEFTDTFLQDMDLKQWFLNASGEAQNLTYGG